MSNIPLRSLTFPGSSNKYIIPVPDETLSLEGAPADAKAVGDALVNKADTSSFADRVIAEGSSGVWTYRKWASGNAECWCSVPVTNYVIENAWGSLIDGPAIAIPQFPFTFASVPKVQITFNSFGSVAIPENLVGVTRNSGGTTYLFRGAIKTTINGNLEVYVFGTY